MFTRVRILVKAPAFLENILLYMEGFLPANGGWRWRKNSINNIFSCTNCWLFKLCAHISKHLTWSSRLGWLIQVTNSHPLFFLFFPKVEWAGPVKSVHTNFLLTFVQQKLLSNIWASSSWDKKENFFVFTDRSFLGGNKGKPQAHSLWVKRWRNFQIWRGRDVF